MFQYSESHSQNGKNKRRNEDESLTITTTNSNNSNSNKLNKYLGYCNYYDKYGHKADMCFHLQIYQTKIKTTTAIKMKILIPTRNRIVNRAIVQNKLQVTTSKNKKSNTQEI